jgi:hypothetical protein
LEAAIDDQAETVVSSEPATDPDTNESE